MANLLRYSPSGVYFARVRVGGKLFRESLKTNVFAVAELCLADFIKEQRSELGVETRLNSGRMTLGDSLEIFQQRLNGDPDLKPGAKLYRHKCIAALLRTWPDLSSTSVTRITKDASLFWAQAFAQKYSASVLQQHGRHVAHGARNHR